MADTDKKKLSGSGLGVVWGRVKALFNGLSATVETNSIKHLGRVELLSLSATFEKNSIINCAGIIYLSSDQVTGLPTNIVTEDGAMVTDDGEVVVDGDNAQAKWVYVAGRVIDDTPIINSDNVVRSGGIYNDLQTKADKTDLQGYVNNCEYNQRTQSVDLKHDDVVVCSFGVSGAIADAMKPFVERLELIEGRYVYDE